MRKIGILLASALAFVAVGCGSDSTSSPKNDGSTRLDSGTAPGTDGGNVNPGVDGPATPVADAPASPDVPTVIDAPAVDTGAVDGPGVLDGKGIDSSPAIDGGKGIDGGKAIDGGAIACTNLPTCLAPLAGCIPQGACRSQADVTTGATTACYDNGVKLVNQTGATGISITAKNGNAVCYAMVLDYASILSGGPIPVQVKDGAGSLLATLTVTPAADGGTQTMTVLCPGAAQAVPLDSSCTGAIAVGATSSSSCTTGTCP